jgi:hypothetical protein
VAARNAGDRFPRWRAVKPHRSLLKLMLRGSNRPGLGSGMDYAACVITLDSKRGLGGAQSGVHGGGGGSARRGSPVSERWAALGFRCACSGLSERARSEGKWKRGWCGAVSHCSMPASARLRLCGSGTPASGHSGLMRGLQAMRPNAGGPGCKLELTKASIWAERWSVVTNCAAGRRWPELGSTAVLGIRARLEAEVELGCREKDHRGAGVSFIGS